MYLEIFNLLIYCLLIRASYYIVPILLSYHENYNTFSKNRQLYIVKNIIKSLILALLTLRSVHLMSSVIFNTPLSNSYVKNFASLYVANDIVGLITLPKLPFSTKFHHSMTTILLFYNYTIDYKYVDEYSVAKLLIVLTCLSCYAFLVNMYLALRYLEYDGSEISENKRKFNKVIDILRVVAFYIYTCTVFFNLSYHTYDLVINPFTVSKFLYIILLVPIINDDFVLLGWLKNKNK
jgi:hypothetical protein